MNKTYKVEGRFTMSLSTYELWLRTGMAVMVVGVVITLVVLVLNMWSKP